MNRGDAMKVVWIDPTTSAGWFDLDELESLEPVETIGFFIEENNTTLWLATTYHTDTEQFCDQLIFPKGCIIDVILL